MVEENVDLLGLLCKRSPRGSGLPAGGDGRAGGGAEGCDRHRLRPTRQRCHIYSMSNLFTRLPNSTQSFVATIVRMGYQQPSSEEMRAQYGRVVEQLAQRFPEAAHLLVAAEHDIMVFPVAHSRQIWSNSPREDPLAHGQWRSRGAT